MRAVWYFTIFFAAMFYMVSCSSCKKDKNNQEQYNEQKKEAYDMLPPEQQVIIDEVTHWNALHDSTNIDSLEQFYADQVLFFKKVRSKKDIISLKKYRMKHADSYRERIIGRVGIYAADTGDYKCEFLKLVTINEKPSVFHSYLIFKKMQDNTFRIIVESDKESDNKKTFIYDTLFTAHAMSESLSQGDFNGDGTKETLIIQAPEQDTLGNYSSTTTKITFDNLELPEIILQNTVGVNVLNENDVDGDGSDDFSVVIKKPNGEYGNVILYSFKRGNWVKLADFRALNSEVNKARQNLIDFAGSGNIKIRESQKTSDGRDTVIIKTISTWGD